jgi:hypothetical protein
MDFDSNFQELMKIEQVAPICFQMTHQLMKRNLELKICEFLDFLQEFDSKSFEFYSSLLRVRLPTDFMLD